MAKKSTVPDITLRKPVGINNYTGDVFRCFTRGDTIPFKFTFRNSDGSPIDVTGWKVLISFGLSLSCNEPGCSDPALVIEVEIPVVDAENGVFAGEVNQTQTQNIPCGLIYASAKYTTEPIGTPPDEEPGNTHIIDMCQLEVYPNVSPTIY